MKAIIVARVSTEEQKDAGNSLEAQIERAKKYCQNKGFIITEAVSFDESAYKKNRKEFDRVINLILDQKEKIAVCFDKVDRLSRDTFDKRVALLFDKSLRDEIELHFVSDGQIINSYQSAAKKLNFPIRLCISKCYSCAISNDCKKAQEQKLHRGEFPGKAQYGYKISIYAMEKLT